MSLRPIERRRLQVQQKADLQSKFRAVLQRFVAQLQCQLNRLEALLEAWARARCYA